MLITKQQIESMTSEQLANKVLTSGEALRVFCNYAWSYCGMTVAEVIKKERGGLITFFNTAKRNSFNGDNQDVVVYPLSYVSPF